jgi:integral membrane protein
MAYVTGGFLLLLCVEMVLKYGFNSGEAVLGDWIAFVHGWIYILYLMTVIDLWSTLRWPLGRLAQLVLAGVVPVVSFIAERKVTAEVTELIRMTERRG